jgi:hypothetical protein
VVSGVIAIVILVVIIIIAMVIAVIRCKRHTYVPATSALHFDNSAYDSRLVNC